MSLEALVQGIEQSRINRDYQWIFNYIQDRVQQLKEEFQPYMAIVRKRFANTVADILTPQEKHETIIKELNTFLMSEKTREAAENKFYTQSLQHLNELSSTLPKGVGNNFYKAFACLAGKPVSTPEYHDKFVAVINLALDRFYRIKELC